VLSPEIEESRIGRYSEWLLSEFVVVQKHLRSPLPRY
jgi:hypothetical protein